MRSLFMMFIVGLHRAGADLAQLTETNFDALINESATFVKFFSPGCPHCQKIAPTWEKLAKAAPSYPQPFMVGEVDCTSETMLCERFGIRGVPALIYFREGKMYKYAGNREYTHLLKFGAGDYKLATESSDIPAAGGSNILSKATYTMAKFMKDLHAVLRFNHWVALLILVVGFLGGVMVTFLFMVATMRVDNYSKECCESPAPSEPESEPTAANPKSPNAKKDD